MATAEVMTGLSGVTEHGVVLEGVSWETYEKLLRGIGERKIFVTYDSGTMEIEMSPGRKHERGSDILVGLIHSIRTLRGIPIEAGGSVTHRREDLAKGIEADACYWVANEKEMRGVEVLDLEKHPPPDLVIEVDETSSSSNRIEIFRHLGAPEVWRLVNDKLEFLVLSQDKKSYASAENSLSFPFVSRGAVQKAVLKMKSVGESEALDQLLSDLGLR